MSQLSFPFQVCNDLNPYREEDFLLLAENSASVNFLQKFFAQKNFSNSQFQSLILKGAASSGTTHLLKIFAQKNNAEFLNKEKISDVNLAEFFSANQFYILENFDEIRDEELILRLINSASEAQAFLILSVSLKLKFSLPDLLSRLKNIFVTEIKTPSQESVKLLLANGLSRRQIKLSRAVINFISGAINRHYETIFAVVKLIELHCQEGGKNLTTKEVRVVLKSCLLG